MGVKIKNNAFGVLLISINTSATSITLQTGQGANFPSLGAGDYFYATLIDTSNNLEIVKVTARTGDVLTIVRAQEGTSARSYAVGDRIELRLTAQNVLDLITDYVNTGDALKLNLTGGTLTGGLKIKTADPLRMGVGPYSGIDFFPIGSGTQSSPFIRFYDLPSGQDIDTTTTVDDCNWAIGADDTGVSSFKILYGGGTGSTRVATIEGVAAPFEIKDDLFTRLNVQTSLVTDTQGTTSISGTSQFSPYNTTPTRGSYLVSVSIQSRGGSATGGDQDQSCITLYKNGTAMATADVFRTDSSYISYEDYGSFTVIVNVNGSDTLRTTLYTTDPGDPGGADVNYNVRVWKIGA